MRNMFRRKDQAVCMRLLCIEPGKQGRLSHLARRLAVTAVVGVLPG
jgi:hypothetical protein